MAPLFLTALQNGCILKELERACVERNGSCVRILVLSQHWEPESGVAQRRWAWLSRILVDAGHEVFVVAPNPGQSVVEFGGGLLKESFSASTVPIQEGNSGERIVRSQSVKPGHSLTSRVLNQFTVALGQLVMLRRLSRDNAPSFDLLIGTVPALPTAAIALFGSKILRAPFAIDLRDAWPDLLEYSNVWNKGTGRRSVREKVLGLGPKQIALLATKKILDASFDRAAGIMLTSSLLQYDLSTRFPKGPEKYVTVRNVFPTESDFTTSPSAAVRTKPLDELNVLYAGTIGRAQDLSNAVRAAEILNAEGGKVNLRLIGGGAAADYLRELAEKSSANITVETKKMPNELADCYQWADTTLVHLTDWEPLRRAVPSKTYELMGASKHITAVISGETRRIIEEMEAGVVVAPGNPIALATAWRELIVDPERLKVSDKGAQWVRDQRQKYAPKMFLDFIETCGCGHA